MATFNSTGTGGNWTDDSTWAEAGQPAADGTDHVIITAGDTVTLTANTGTGSIKISGTIEGGGYTLTLSSAYSNKPFDNDGTIDSGSDLNVTITNTGTQQDGLFCDFNQASQGNINDLTINLANGTTANKTVTCGGDTTIDGDLIITSGTLDTSSSSNVALTVTGDCDITGTLTANASVMDLFSMRINHGGTYNATSGTTTLSDSDTSAWGKVLYVNDNGTFNHNNGTMKFDGGSVPEITVINQSLTKNPYYNLWCSGDVCAVYNSTFVLNNATVRGIRFNGGVTDYFHVVGICENTADDFSEAGKESESANNYFGTFHLSGGKLLLTQMEITVGSFRNTGGTVE